MEGPLIQYYDNGWRCGYLQLVRGFECKVQPMKPLNGAQPVSVWVKAQDVRAVKDEDINAILAAHREPVGETKEEGMPRKSKSKREKQQQEKKPKSQRTFSLVVDLEVFKPGSWAYAVAKALDSGAKTRDLVLAYVIEHDLVKDSKMDPAVAVSWTLNNLVGKKALKVSQ
jgi:hypothetical protein